ncbi:MAG: Na+/H+ antiporter subunit E [Micropruina sp.]|uniref:Na+/H+ antiporter subunit E n=1 Tax=Micropruina sp. TaxID=2737536 RepID=UPI0039E61378
MRRSSSRRRLRWRLQWRAILALTVLWVILWGNYSLVDICVGLVLSWLVTVTFPLPPIRYHGRLRPLGLVRLAAATVRDLAVSSWRLAVAAFGPRIDFHPAVIRVPLRSNQDLYQVETAEIISIVPGSIVIDARRSNRMLYLHLVDVDGPDGVEHARRESLKVERRVLEAIGSNAELDALRRREELDRAGVRDGEEES